MSLVHMRLFSAGTGSSATNRARSELRLLYPDSQESCNFLWISKGVLLSLLHAGEISYCRARFVFATFVTRSRSQGRFASCKDRVMACEPIAKPKMLDVFPEPLTNSCRLTRI